jgi:hypothetical protein
MLPTPWYYPRFGVDPLFSPLSSWAQWFSAMEFSHKIQFVLYLALWLGAFLSTQIYWVYSDGNFSCDIFASTGASSITYDLLFVGFAILLFILGDFWEMGFSIYTYMLTFAFSFLVAVSVTVPLYLAMRLLRIAAKKQSQQQYATSGTSVYHVSEIQTCTSLIESFVPLVLYLLTMVYWWYGPTPFPEPELCEGR